MAKAKKDPKYKDILFEVVDQVAWVTINRPHTLNACRELTLDEITDAEVRDPERPDALYDLNALDVLLNRPELLPPGIEVKPMGNGEYEYSMPGLGEKIRVTTNAEYFDQHSGSMELWSPGSPAFPGLDSVATVEEVVAVGGKLRMVLLR